jgi:hypothetical protein
MFSFPSAGAHDCRQSCCGWPRGERPGTSILQLLMDPDLFGGLEDREPWTDLLISEPAQQPITDCVQVWSRGVGAAYSVRSSALFAATFVRSVILSRSYSWT